MKLLDEPLSGFEKDDTMRMLKGSICRICVSDDVEEVVRSLGFAVERLSLIAYSRVKELRAREEKSG